MGFTIALNVKEKTRWIYLPNLIGTLNLMRPNLHSIFESFTLLEGTYSRLERELTVNSLLLVRIVKYTSNHLESNQHTNIQLALIKHLEKHNLLQREVVSIQLQIADNL